MILADAGDEPLCNIPEGCDSGGDGAPDKGAGAAQYDGVA